MDPERQETYERIPWETLEKPRNDRQWVVIAVSVAVALGALAYSFMRNQPTASPAEVLVSQPSIAPPTIPPASPPNTSPIIVTEADLYAVDPERRIDQAAAHAEWLTIEYFSADGSEDSTSTLRALLPAAVPLPTVPEGTQVFVDWVSARNVSEVAPLTYRVEVVVRSMVSGPDGVFTRLPARVATIDVVFGEDGLPRIAGAPVVAFATPPESAVIDLVQVPPHVASQVSAYGEVVGGRVLPNGLWEVIVMVTGPDGVIRPTNMALSG
ncbi:MAG: hypothetical protein R3258_00750 [Acidimicrobiia bacterium]|nr:hypothetical protein [Acidimicrobiia bacterium]